MLKMLRSQTRTRDDAKRFWGGRTKWQNEMLFDLCRVRHIVLNGIYLRRVNIGSQGEMVNKFFSRLRNCVWVRVLTGKISVTQCHVMPAFTMQNYCSTKKTHFFFVIFIIFFLFGDVKLYVEGCSSALLNLAKQIIVRHINWANIRNEGQYNSQPIKIQFWWRRRWCSCE